MHQAEIILLFDGRRSSGRARAQIALPYPIVLVLGGLALSFVPRLPAVNLNPDVCSTSSSGANLSRCVFTSWLISTKSAADTHARHRLVLATTPRCLDRAFHCAGASVGGCSLPSAQCLPPDAVAAAAIIRGWAFLIGYR